MTDPLIPHRTRERMLEAYRAALVKAQEELQAAQSSGMRAQRRRRVRELKRSIKTLEAL